MLRQLLFNAFFVFGLSNLAKSRTLKLSGGDVNFNRRHFHNFTVAVQNNALSMDMHIIKPLVSGFQVKLEFQLRSSQAKPYQSIFSYSTDVCRMVASLKISIFKKWFESFRRYGNFLASCPVKEGHYYVRDWKCDGSAVPTYLYQGEYRILTRGYYGKYKSKNEEYVFDSELRATII